MPSRKGSASHSSSLIRDSSDFGIVNGDHGQLLFTVLDALLDEFREGMPSFVYYIDTPLFRQAMARFVSDVLKQHVHAEQIKIAGVKPNLTQQTVVAWHIQQISPEQYTKCIRALDDPAMDLEIYFGKYNLCRTSAHSWRSNTANSVAAASPLLSKIPTIQSISDAGDNDWNRSPRRLSVDHSISARGDSASKLSELQTPRIEHPADTPPAEPPVQAPEPADSQSPPEPADHRKVSKPALAADQLWSSFGHNLVARIDPAMQPKTQPTPANLHAAAPSERRSSFGRTLRKMSTLAAPIGSPGSQTMGQSVRNGSHSHRTSITSGLHCNASDARVPQLPNIRTESGGRLSAREGPGSVRTPSGRAGTPSPDTSRLLRPGLCSGDATLNSAIERQLWPHPDHKMVSTAPPPLMPPHPLDAGWQGPDAGHPLMTQADSLDIWQQTVSHSANASRRHSSTPAPHSRAAEHILPSERFLRPGPSVNSALRPPLHDISHSTSLPDLHLSRGAALEGVPA